MRARRSLRSRNQQAGFTLIEVMTALAMVAGLTAVAVPAMTEEPQQAKPVERTELERITNAAKAVFLADGAFPQGTTTTLPGNPGAACSFSTKKFPTTAAWVNDIVWGTLDFAITQPTQYSYRYESIDANTAVVTAIADLDCTGKLTKITLTLTGVEGDVIAAREETSVEIAATGDVAAASAGSESDGDSDYVADSDTGTTDDTK